MGLAEAAGCGGFALRPKDQGFVRPIPGGRQQISVPLWDTAPTLAFSLVLGIRLDAVEARRHRAADTPPQYRGESLTTMTQLEHLGESPNAPQGVVFSVSSEAELDSALVRVSALLAHKTLPFFERYRTLEALDAVLHDESSVPAWQIDPASVNAMHQPHRAISSVAVAHLARNPRTAALIERYRHELAGFVAPEREIFERFVEGLHDDR